MVNKESWETGTAMQRLATVWKCLALGNRQYHLGDYSTDQEALRSRLLRSGVTGNYDDVSWSRAPVRSASLRPRRTPLTGSQGVRGKCCRRGWGLHDDGVAPEKKWFSRPSRFLHGSSLVPLTIRIARRCMRSIKAMSLFLQKYCPLFRLRKNWIIRRKRLRHLFLIVVLYFLNGKYGLPSPLVTIKGSSLQNEKLHEEWTKVAKRCRIDAKIDSDFLNWFFETCFINYAISSSV